LRREGNRPIFKDDNPVHRFILLILAPLISDPAGGPARIYPGVEVRADEKISEKREEKEGTEKREGKEGEEKKKIAVLNLKPE
jgi:hypothetical protein